MSVLKWITGFLEIEISSASVETALESFIQEGIELLGLRRLDELTCCFQIKRNDVERIRNICKKRGDNLRILRHFGLYWSLQSACRRQVLLTSIVILLAVTLFLPSRVLFVQVEGNAAVPSGQILAAAEDCGICFGASRRDVRSERVKNALLSAVPQLQWAGVNTSGCVATISVRERTEEQTTEAVPQVSRIVASRDGYILSTTVTQGNLLVQVGQTVKEDQPLISGYTDCGLCIQATRARGEIFAQTKQQLEAVTPSEFSSRGAILQVKRKFSLLFRKKRINLWKDSGISHSSCGRMYKEYYITLPGGFELPIALCVEVYTSYENTEETLPQEDAQANLTAFAEGYLLQHMIAGKILQGSQTVLLEEGIYRLKGQYICTEMIGRERQEEIGDTNGENS